MKLELFCPDFRQILHLKIELPKVHITDEFCFQTFRFQTFSSQTFRFQTFRFQTFSFQTFSFQTFRFQTFRFQTSAVLLFLTINVVEKG